MIEEAILIECPEGIVRNVKIPKYVLEGIKNYKKVIDCRYSYSIRGFPFEKCSNCESKAFIVKVNDSKITIEKFPY